MAHTAARLTPLAGGCWWIGSKCWGGRWRMGRRRLEFLVRRRMGGCNGGVPKVKLASSTGRLGRTGVRPGCPKRPNRQLSRTG